MTVKHKRAVLLETTLILAALGLCFVLPHFGPPSKFSLLSAIGGVLGVLLLLTLWVQISKEAKRRDQLEIELVNTHSQFRSILDSNFIGILFWDAKGTIIETNSTLSKLLGYDEKDLATRSLTWNKLVPQTSGPKIAEILRNTSETGYSPPFEIELISSTQKLVPVLVATSRLREAENQNVAFIMDRSEQRKVELKLAAHTQALEQSNRDLQEFAYVASHDLQEPLRMVSSYMQLLSERYKGKLDRDADDFIEFAVDGAKRMQQLINDLLAFARLNREGEKFEQVNMEDVLNKVVDGLKFSIKECNAKIEHDELPVVFGNPSQLSQLLSNLLGNAIKYRGDKAPLIQISAKLENELWYFSVRDNGIGIEKEFNEKIFKIFQRLHGRDKYSGSGIGLAICRRIVGIHCGQIWAESEFGKGSNFLFTIPNGGASLL
ncbi:MAG: ATP-binding protein [Bdellovibrionia bacterium]